MNVATVQWQVTYTDAKVTYLKHHSMLLLLLLLFTIR
jgi:hypothetical protein